MPKTTLRNAAELRAALDNYPESDKYLWAREVQRAQYDTWKAFSALHKVAESESRGLRASEQREADRLAKQHEELDALVREENIDLDRSQIIQTGGSPPPGGVTGDGVGFGVGTQGRIAGARGTSSWTRQATETVRSTMTGQDGAFSVHSGSMSVPPPLSVRADPIPSAPPSSAPDPLRGQQPTTATRVVELLTRRRELEGTNTFSYLRQTERDNQATVVADGAVKPTSKFTLEEIEDRVRVVAHLSEPIPMRAFNDSPDLGEFLETEMRAGVLDALEAEVLTGSGTGEHIQGLVNVSSIVQQDWTTDLPTTLRKSRTRLRMVNEVPTAWVVHPEQTEAIDLLREGADGMFLAGTWTENIVGRLPVVESVAVDPDVAILADWSLLELVIREDGRLDVDAGGELFKTNQVILRLEGRYGSAVRRTTAFCVVDLAAPTTP